MMLTISDLPSQPDGELGQRLEVLQWYNLVELLLLRPLDGHLTADDGRQRLCVFLCYWRRFGPLQERRREGTGLLVSGPVPGLTLQTAVPGPAD